MDVNKFSEFIILSEIDKMYKKTRLVRESLEIDKSESYTEEESGSPQFSWIIKNSVESIEIINSNREKKEKEILDKFGKKKIRSKSEEEFSQAEVEAFGEIKKIDDESKDKTKDLIEEIIPNRNNTKELKEVKKSLINQIFDDLTKNSRKFFLITLMGFLGYSGVNSLFNDNKLAKQTIEIVKDYDKNTNMASLDAYLNDTEVKSNSEVVEDILEPRGLTEEQINLIDSKIKKFTKKGIEVIHPSDIEIGGKFTKSKTVFLSGKFPYQVSNKTRSDVDLSSPKRKHLYNKYLPIVDEIVDDPGLKLLALSMAYFEGFEPGSISYKTNNPGNIGNTDSGGIKKFTNLRKGVYAQIEKIKQIINNKESNYPIGSIVSQEPYYSRELMKTVPGFIFLYEGTLEQFLKIYATGPRDHNNYLNSILTFFNTYYPEANVTEESKISDIIKIGRKGSSLKKMIDSKRAEKK